MPACSQHLFDTIMVKDWIHIHVGDYEEMGYFLFWMRLFSMTFLDDEGDILDYHKEEDYKIGMRNEVELIGFII